MEIDCDLVSRGRVLLMVRGYCTNLDTMALVHLERRLVSGGFSIEIQD